MAISLIKDALSDFTDQMTLTSLAALTLLLYISVYTVINLAGLSQTFASSPPPPAERNSL